MAEQAGKPAKDAPGGGEEKAAEKKAGRSMATWGAIGGVMVVEGLAIFLCMRFLGAHPDPSEGLTLQPTTQKAEEKAEIEVAKVRVPNSNGARTTLYSMSFVVVVDSEKKEEIEKVKEQKKWTINDVLSRVIREADPRELGEPGLETMRRKVRFELDQVFKFKGDDSPIQQVLIPECMPVPSGF